MLVLSVSGLIFLKLKFGENEHPYLENKRTGKEQLSGE